MYMGQLVTLKFYDSSDLEPQGNSVAYNQFFIE